MIARRMRVRRRALDTYVRVERLEPGFSREAAGGMSRLRYVKPLAVENRGSEVPSELATR